MCTPDECPYCRPWEGVPGKTRCMKPPLPDTTRPGYEYHDFRFTTTLGGPCVARNDSEQLSLWQ